MQQKATCQHFSREKNCIIRYWQATHWSNSFDCALKWKSWPNSDPWSFLQKRESLRLDAAADCMTIDLFGNCRICGKLTTLLRAIPYIPLTQDSMTEWLAETKWVRDPPTTAVVLNRIVLGILDCLDNNIMVFVENEWTGFTPFAIREFWFWLLVFLSGWHCIESNTYCGG